MLYNIIRFIARVFVAIFYRVRVEGLKNVPEKGAFVLCANHTYYKDLILIGSFTPRKVYWMAKSELFRFPIFNVLIKNLGAFPVKRGAHDRESVKIVYKVLYSGEPLGIFPEGTRVADPENRPTFKRAYVTFAANTGAAILPAALRYEGGPFGRGRLFSRAFLTFGEVVYLEQGRKYERSELEELSASIMSWIHKKIISY